MMRRITIGLISFVAILLISSSWLVMTESGLASSLALVHKFVPNLTINSAQGRLYDGAALTQVRYDIDSDNSVAINKINVSWHAMSLLQGQINLDKLELEDVALQLTSSEQKNNEPIVLPEIALPFAVQIKRLLVSNLTLQQNDTPQTVLITRLDSAMEIMGNKLVIANFQFNKDDQINVGLSGQLKLTGNYPTSFDYQWQYAQTDLTTYEGAGTIRGDLANLNINQTLTQPVLSKQQISIQDILGQLQWQLKISADTITLAQIDSRQQGELSQSEVTATGSLTSAVIKLKTKFSYPDLPELEIENISSSNDFDNWLTKLTVKAVVQQAAINIAGKINTVSTTPTLELTGNWQQLTWPLTNAEPQISTEQGNFVLSGDMDNYELTLNADLKAQQQSINMALLAKGSSTQISIENLKIAALGGQTSIAGSANWSTLPVQFDLTGDWAELELPASLSSIAIASQQGTITMSGTTEQFTVSSAIDLNVNATPLAIEFDALGSTVALNDLKLKSKLGTGTANFQGKLDWQQGIKLLGDLSFDKLDPQLLAAQWPGRLSGKSTIDFEQNQQGQLQLELNGLHIKGQLRQRPVQLDSDLRYAKDNLDVKRLLMHSGQSSLTMSGAISKEMTFNWQFDSPDLTDFYPELTGRLAATGEVTGTVQAPIIKADITGSDVRYSKQIAVDELNSQLSLVLSDNGQMQATLSLKELSVNSLKHINAQLALNGHYNYHQISFAVSDQENSVTARAQGNYVNQQWQGQFSQFEIDSKQAGQWSMTETGLIKLSAQTQNIGRHCLNSQQSNICLKANHDDDSWQAQGKFSQVPMNLLYALSAELEQLTGDINGEFEIAGEGSYPRTGHGQISLDNGRIKVISDALETQQTIGLQQAAFDYQLADNSSQIKLAIVPDLEGASAIVGQITSAAIADIIEHPEQTVLSGKLTTQVDELAVFGSLHPGYEALHGELKVDINLVGTISQPVFMGDISLDKASVELPSLGIVLTELAAKAQGDLNGITFDYQAKSGEGLLTGNGEFELGQQAWQLTTSLKGDKIQLVSLPEAYVVASPDLTFSMDAKQASVVGKIVIPSAELAPTEFNLPVTPSDDVVVINDVVIEDKTAFPTKVNVNVMLGDKVFITGVGFKARLTGKLAVTGISNDVLYGNGEIVIKDGGYLVYGQKLAIDDGKVIFAGGAVENPNLDIKAVRKSNGVTAGVQIEGSANDPQISLYSKPTLNQDDILAYLIIGRPLAEASVTDAALLATAATGLGLGQTSDQISSTFGLDTLELSGSGGDDTAVQVGKYLSPKLYLGYGIGIFEPVSTVTLRYKLSKIWSIKAESGVEAGVDFLYTHER